MEQLPARLNELEPVALTGENLDILSFEHGVYQLFWRDESKYFGKSQDTLRVRLYQHLRRCMGRVGIDVRDMKFRCLYVDKFVDSAAPESVLIKRYREEGLAGWNISEGFAPKDVGRGRPDGRPGQWFIDRPVDFRVGVNLHEIAGREIPVLDALLALKKAVPFDLFKFASERSQIRADRESVVDYGGRTVVLEPGPVPLMQHLRRVIEVLPDGWQAVVQPPGIMIYRELVDYAYAIGGWRRQGGQVAALGAGHSLPDNEVYRELRLAII
ncbi:GIY-YIG nuclease family protein [Actinoplanes sp. NBRC 101535]|uniref:GIY-YIG nuclease family protein n=1 Tax=Actinoplanes sp. NBRC 101535 TaxID=3032196 RepID=UPI002552A9F6|nr:GIY-YIG nuclease family protein [Actinoplanes sp. NBRC 101535]